MTGTLWTWPKASLLEVHDGDTVRLSISIGFDMRAYEWIRLAGVGAPELDEPDGLQAKADCESWFAEHAPDGQVGVVTVQTSRLLEVSFRQSFTRYVGTVHATDRPDVELNGWLRSKGYTDQGM